MTDQPKTSDPQPDTPQPSPQAPDPAEEAWEEFSAVLREWMPEEVFAGYAARMRPAFGLIWHSRDSEVARLQGQLELADKLAEEGNRVHFAVQSSADARDLVAAARAYLAARHPVPSQPEGEHG